MDQIKNQDRILNWFITEKDPFPKYVFYSETLGEVYQQVQAYLKQSNHPLLFIEDNPLFSIYKNVQYFKNLSKFQIRQEFYMPENLYKDLYKEILQRESDEIKKDSNLMFQECQELIWIFGGIISTKKKEVHHIQLLPPNFDQYKHDNNFKKILRKNCYYGKVYSFNLIYESIIQNKFDNSEIDDYIVCEIKDNFYDVQSCKEMSLEKFVQKYPLFFHIYQKNNIKSKQSTNFRETIYIIKQQLDFTHDSYQGCCEMAFLGGQIPVSIRERARKVFESLGKNYGDQQKVFEYLKDFFASHIPKRYSLTFEDPPLVEDQIYKTKRWSKFNIMKEQFQKNNQIQLGKEFFIPTQNMKKTQNQINNVENQIQENHQHSMNIDHTMSNEDCQNDQDQQEFNEENIEQHEQHQQAQESSMIDLTDDILQLINDQIEDNSQLQEYQYVLQQIIELHLQIQNENQSFQQDNSNNQYLQKEFNDLIEKAESLYKDSDDFIQCKEEFLEAFRFLM